MTTRSHRLISFAAALVVVLGSAMPSFAVNPDEVLDDPALEARARSLSAGLRCMVCQNQSIDDSNAELARDLRVLVRERLVAGDTDDQVIAYVVSRYGDFVLLKPPVSASTMLLWATPALVLAAGVAFVFLRRRPAAGARSAGAQLSAAEQSEIEKLLRDREQD